MSPINSRISKLRRISFFLFLFPTLAVIISLLAHNVIVEFDFKSKHLAYEGNFPIDVQCNEKNNYCASPPFKEYRNFDQCEKNIINTNYLVDNNKFTGVEYINRFTNNNVLKDAYKTSNIKMTYVDSGQLNNKCILNSSYLKFYRIFPGLFYFLEKIKKNKKYSPATSGMVNPFIYGETSISNIVKRYPVNLIFKPLIYIGSILMILYWLSFDKIFRKISENNNIKKFTIFGIASSIFLFFHVMFLGTTIDNEIFNKIRKLILVLFILCEIAAQTLLTRRLYLSLNIIENFIFKNVLNLKIIFVSITVVTSIIILIILSVSNLSSKVDYILEWNYFVFLLIFYFLSAIIWKK